MKRVIQAASTSKSDLVKAVGYFWDAHPGQQDSSVREMQEWMASNGIDATYKEIDEAWDAWASEYYSEDETVIDDEISTREEAAAWLDAMIAEHGSTYHWSNELRAKLDGFIERFGSTYFWRK